MQVEGGSDWVIPMVVREGKERERKGDGVWVPDRKFNNSKNFKF
jgi:hypothetical protein